MTGARFPGALAPYQTSWDRFWEAGVGTRTARSAWATEQNAREAAIRILGAPIFDFLDAALHLYTRASEEAALVVTPYSNLPRRDRLRRVVLAAALDSALDQQFPGEKLGELFNPAGLAYFGIAVGLDGIPKEMTGKDQVRSAALVFKQDHKNLWRQLLREELDQRKGVKMVSRPIRERTSPSSQGAE
jgi:hypothetical protein